VPPARVTRRYRGPPRNRPPVPGKPAVIGGRTLRRHEGPARHDAPAVRSPRRPDCLLASLQQACVFDDGGSPAVWTTRKPPGRLARLAGEAFESMPKVSLTVTSIRAVVAIALAVIPASLRLMPIAQLIQHLR
jgi:hypothetical protein